MGIVSAVRPYEFEPRKTATDFVEHERRSISILDAGRMDDDAQRQALRIDQRVNLAALHLFAGVETGQAVMAAPFSADFTDWLSMIAAVGLASRSMSSRNSTCSCSQIASHTPSFWKLRKML